MLIESDNVAKTIMNLVVNLNIRKLVIGTSKSNLRYHVTNHNCVTLYKLKIIIAIFCNCFIRKSGSRRQDGSIADMVLKNSQESCDIKIICEGREVIDQMIDCTSPRLEDKGNAKLRGFPWRRR